MQEKWRAASLAGRLGKERSTAGRRGREGQKGTAALRAVPPLENPVGSRLGRAQREASPRRLCKTPQKAASDEPIGKHRRGGPAKPRRRPPRTSPTGSIVSVALQKPAEGRLRRAHREASPRRPCAVSLAGRQGKGRSMTRASGKLWKRVGTARRFAWAGTGARHPFPGRRGKEGQKGTAALRAAPPLENSAESRLRRAHRQASSRRPCKSPQKAASDEPIGKHRRGGPAKPRRRPPRTSPTGSIVSVALQKPVEARLGRAHREASPRRVRAASLAGRLGKERSTAGR